MPDLHPVDNMQATVALANDIGFMISVLAKALTNGTSDLTFDDFANQSPGSGPKFTVLVNSLWLLSFLISITCALLAISLQQWARRHAKVTPPRYSIPEQARMRAFFANGIETQNFE